MSLPGVAAQDIMAPVLRNEQIKALNTAEKSPRHAGVMVLCYPKNQEMYFVLILRPTYEGVHSDQVALPGGKAELYDANYEETALRELGEEVGVPREDVHVISTLTETYVPPSNYWVHPFFGYCDTTPDFIPQPEEVAKIVEVRLDELLDDAHVISEIVTASYAKAIEVPTFKLNDYKVWGATAMMLNELKVILKTSLNA